MPRENSEISHCFGEHSLIIDRDVLILTLSIFKALWGCISWYSLAIGLISDDMIYRDHIIQYTPCALGRVQGNTSLGTVFPRTLPRANTRDTSSRGKHWQCSSSDAEWLIVDICRQAKCHDNALCVRPLN